ncbi:hypothetical protein [Nostoc sp.]
MALEISQSTKEEGDIGNWRDTEGERDMRSHISVEQINNAL